MQRWDFLQIFTAMDGLPTTIRLLDPPLHEFLPDITELSVRVALAEARGEKNENDLRLMQAVHSLHEQNPMLGLRGVRLGLVVPGLFDLQVRAIAEATAQLIKLGKDPAAGDHDPARRVGPGAGDHPHGCRQGPRRGGRADRRAAAPALFGTMIELPRAALTAGQIAEAAEFFSFGTNDLTQTTWGFSRDDVEAAFFSTYLEMGIFGVSPFETLDVEGVGELVRLGTERGPGHPARPEGRGVRRTRRRPRLRALLPQGRPGLRVVSPFRIPVARLEAGRVALEGGAGADSR